MTVGHAGAEHRRPLDPRTLTGFEPGANVGSRRAFAVDMFPPVLRASSKIEACFSNQWRRTKHAIKQRELRRLR